MTESKTEQSLRKAFDALGDKTRFALFSRMVNKCDSCVSELADDLQITPAGASQQLKVLEQTGLLVRVRKGQRICYEVNQENPNIKQIVTLIKREAK